MDLLLDPSTWSRWQPEVLSAEGAGRLSKGDQVRGRARLLGLENVQGRSLAVEVGEGCFEEDTVVGLGMRVRYEVKPGPTGCVVTHRLESDLLSGLAGRVLSMLLRVRLRKMQRDTLEQLVSHSEAQERS